MKKVFRFILISTLFLFVVSCLLAKIDLSNVKEANAANAVNTNIEIVSSDAQSPQDIHMQALYSSVEFPGFINAMQPYINELSNLPQLIESTGIKLDSFYIDSEPLLLIIEVKLQNVNAKELDKVVNNASKSNNRLAPVLNALRLTVSASKTRIAQFSLNTVQIRVGLGFPPPISTRLKFSRT